MKNIKEAKRYLANADKLLQENCTIDEYGNYSDEKYVKMAGDTAWKGVLKALDPLHPKLKRGKRKSVDTYRLIFEKRDKKAMNVYNNAYNQLHLSMGYDRVTSSKLKKSAWSDFKNILNWVEKNTK